MARKLNFTIIIIIIIIINTKTYRLKPEEMRRVASCHLFACRDANLAWSLSNERSIYAQSQNWCSKLIYEVYMYIAKNFCHEGATVLPFYLLLCSGGEATAPVVSLHNGFRGTFS